MKKGLLFLVVVFIVVSVVNAQTGQRRLHSAMAYAERGWAHLQNGNYNLASEDLLAAVRLEPNNAMFLTMLGGAYSEAGNYEQAINAFTRSIQLRPDVAMPYNGRAWVYAYHLKRNCEQAIADANIAIRIEPRNGSYYDTRGWAYLCKGDYDNAENDFITALQFNPDIDEAREGLQRICEAQEAETGENRDVGINYNLLQKRGDVYYERATNRPYTGKAFEGERTCMRGIGIMFTPGTEYRLMEMRNGRLHGKVEGGTSEGGFHFVAHYKDGVLHGESSMSDHGEGYRGTYKDGIKHGLWTYYEYDNIRVEYYVNGEPYTGSDVIFNADRTVLLFYPRGRQGAYTIPNGVITIGDGAFSNNTRLTSVTIPNSVTSIGNSAFSNTGLTSVTIPNSVTTVGYGAFFNTGLTSLTIGNGIRSTDALFYGITNLTSITIGSGITSIESHIFADLTNLESIEIATNNPTYSSVDGVLFNKNRTTLLLYPIGKRNREYAIPSSVTTIGEGAFRGNQNLTSITIPNSVTSIGNNAFSNTGLTSVTIPNSITTIGSGAFYGNANLTSITIGSRVTSIGNGAFNGCSNLTTVISLNHVPPRLDNRDRISANLYVPPNSIDAYRNADGWKNNRNNRNIHGIGLSTLTVSRGTLSPRFHSDTLNYTVTLPYADSSLTITAPSTHPIATVTGAGEKSLRVGENVFSRPLKIQKADKIIQP